MAEPFERDFGYLVPFLDKVQQAAAQLSDPAARSEATRLAAEEKARWARMRALLAGAAGATASSNPEVSPGPAVRTAPRLGRPEGFTVGSLRPGAGGPRRGR